MCSMTRCYKYTASVCSDLFSVIASKRLNCGERPRQKESKVRLRMGERATNAGGRARVAAPRRRRLFCRTARKRAHMCTYSAPLITSGEAAAGKKHTVEITYSTRGRVKR